MFKLCNFCLEQVTAKDAVSVKDLVIDKNPGIIKFTEILFDISLYFSTESELICERCLDSVVNFFNFKERLRRNMKQPLRSSQELVNNVSDFLEKTQEEVSIVRHHRCLCLVPESRMELMKFFMQFSPSISLDCDRIKAEPEEYFSNDPLHDVVLVTELKSLDEYESGAHNTEDDESDLLVEKEAAKEFVKNELLPREIKKRGRKRKLVNVFTVTETKRQTRSTNYSKRDKAKEDVHSVDSLTNYELSREEKVMLKKQISSSKFTDTLFKCTQCHKIVKSYAACRYHMISQHIKARDATKSWISHKIKESEILTPEGKVIKYNCIVCEKSYPTASGLRYHLKSHVESQNVPVNEIKNEKISWKNETN